MHAILPVMKKYLFLIIVLSCFQGITAQIHEIGLSFGGSNYMGDIGTTSYIRPNEFDYGVFYRFNRSKRHAWRLTYTQSKITGNDEKASAPSRLERGYDFENNIKELSFGLEFNFLEFDLHSFEQKFTPYVFSGLSYFSYDELYHVNGHFVKDGTSRSFAIPMIVGVKTNIDRHWILGAEIGARYTFVDNLDGNNPKDHQALQFGNTNTNDWYVFSNLTLTYTFGEKPCFCRK